MKATRYLFGTLVMGTGLISCNNTGTALIAEETLAPASVNPCMYDPMGLIAMQDIVFDPSSQAGLDLTIKFTNQLQTTMVNFGNATYPDTYTTPTALVPERMDIAWYCDVEGFSLDMGPLYLPQFSTKLPFCGNRVTKGFRGQDEVLARGPSIMAGASGAVSVTIIPAELGKAFSDLFRLAQLAQKCCNQPDAQCNGDNSNVNASAGTDCGNLQAAFDEIAGMGNLSAKSSSDIQKFLPFGLFDANVVVPKPPQTMPPTYSMRVRGVLEAQAGDGSIVSSTEWTDVIHLCNHCGGSSACTQFGP
jgi:hypothetical protein